MTGAEALIGTSDEIIRLRELIKKIANCDIRGSSVVINGESGTGKELIARAIHFESPRRDYPFIPVNCGALPETLLESELFGHLKGAFTDAVKTTDGLFQAANRGTIFLDEITDTSLAVQAKLLRVLQERLVRRVGSIQEIPVDVRVVAAASQRLQNCVRSGKLREDLFYRLNVFDITVSPLRRRGQDVLVLAEHFLVGSGKCLSAEAQVALLGHPWPGNVRELENALVHAQGMAGTRKMIDVCDLPQTVKNEPAVSVVGSLVGFALEMPGIIGHRDWELARADYNFRILKANGGNMRLTAERLRVKRTTLLEYLKKRGHMRKTSGPSVSDPADRVM